VPATSWQHYRAKAAAKRRHHGPAADVSDDLRAMRAAQAEEYVRQLASALDLERRRHLAALLLAGDGS